MTRKCLVVSTVATSLALQMPAAWEVLRDLGFEVTFAATADGNERLLRGEGGFTDLRGSRELSPTRLFRFRNRLQHLMKQPWDLIQIQTPIASAIARTLRRPDCPVLYIVHGFHFHADGSPMSNLVFESIEKVLLRRTDAIAVVSHEDLVKTSSWRSRSNRSVWRLPGAGVDLSLFAGKQRISKNNDFSLLFVGELNSNKNPMLVARVATQFAQLGYRTSVTFVGDGPLSLAIRTHLERDTGIKLKMVPFTSDIRQFMNRSDVLLAPSRREGLPRVIIEALANGLTVVAQSNRGSRELLRDSAGYLVPREAGLKTWVATTLHALSNPCDHERSSRRAHEYSLDSFKVSYQRLIESLQI